MSRRSYHEFFCTCGATFRTAIAEARHRHNFPLLCRPGKGRRSFHTEYARARADAIREQASELRIDAEKRS